MAITNNDVKFLFYGKSLGVSFLNTLTLGRLELYVNKEQISLQADYFRNKIDTNSVNFNDQYADPLFQLLGAEKTDSLDYSDYQGATIIHDLNTTFPENLKSKYSVVIDSGTLEHVFNFPVAIENCMRAIQVGGHFIGVTPANNSMGHGFYQFSPELFYTIFSAANGFEIVKMIITACDEEGNFDNWYEVINPAVSGGRVVLTNQLPTYLLIIAKKISDKKVFEVIPQQSDYTTTWDKHIPQKNVGITGPQGLKQKIKQLIPLRIRVILKLIYTELKKKNSVTKDLGAINTAHFKKMDI